MFLKINEIGTIPLGNSSDVITDYYVIDGYPDWALIVESPYDLLLPLGTIVICLVGLFLNYICFDVSSNKRPTEQASAGSIWIQFLAGWDSALLVDIYSEIILFDRNQKRRKNQIEFCKQKTCEAILLYFLPYFLFFEKLLMSFDAVLVFR